MSSPQSSASECQLTLSDCSFDGDPECFHCDEPFPMTAPVELGNGAVLVSCPKCGCTTPFPVLSSNT
jgi:hypothetical protein